MFLSFTPRSPSSTIAVPPYPPSLSHANFPQLEQALKDFPQSQRLIANLSKDADMKQTLNMVRCAAAVESFEKLKTTNERKAKGRKIVSVFVQNGSMFQIVDLPTDIESNLLLDEEDTRYFWLIKLKFYCWEQLLDNERIHTAIWETHRFGVDPNAVSIINQGEFKTKRSRDLTTL